MSVVLIHGNPQASRRALAATCRPLLLVLLLMVTGSAAAATFVVNNRFDAGTGGCTASECTLREAMVAANTLPGADSINFSFGAFAGRTEILIQPSSPLPTITQAVTINGYSQELAAANTDPLISNARINIRVDGVNAGASASGFAVCASNVLIRGLAITRFNQQGINVGADASAQVCAGTFTGNSVMGNFIGLASNGTMAAGNQVSGVRSNQIVAMGSAAPADRNVIAANGSDGVFLIDFSANGSVIVGNLIGTDKSGALDQGNGSSGVSLDIGVSSVQVGSAASPNLIAFNNRGIRVRDGSGNRLFANHFGPNDGLGIDLLNEAFQTGVSLNDNLDADGGGNGQQNYLDDGFTASRTATGIRIQGALRRPSAGALTYTVAAYASPACDASLHGEGETFLGTATQLTSTAVAPVIVNIPLATQPPIGSFITTTVTSPSGDTSEFSTCAALDPPPLVVNSLNDIADGACNAAHCSLRDAIIVANADPDPSVINFNIASPASGELMIQPTSALPTITAPVTIDGYSQPGTAVNTDPVASNAVLRVRLDGQIAGGSVPGIAVCSNDVTIRGLAVTSFDQRGIAFGTNAAQAICSAPITSGSVIGNFIGLGSDGFTPFGNNLGVRITRAIIAIGSSALADRNVIGSNANSGMRLTTAQSSTSMILGNLIGTDRTGTLDRGNAGAGLELALDTSSVIVGTASAPNLIAHNQIGVNVFGDTTKSNQLWANHYRSNDDDLGIDLASNSGGGGLSPNDLDDIDLGGNGQQNFPVITRAERSAAGLVIGGSLDVRAGTSNEPFVIGVYANSVCHASGFGEGERFLGSATVNLTQTTGESFQFELATNDALEPGVQITTTASGPEGTSEFSACVPATDAPPGIVVTSSVDPGDGVCDVAECTLREAIALANTQPGADLIRFEIPGDGPHDIQLASLLPVITEGLTIDGYTQPGASPNAAASGSDAVLQIQINGLGARTQLLRTCTTDLVELRGLALVRASINAVATRLNDSLNCTSVGSLRMGGNFVGLRPDGTAFSNFSGISVTNTLATIGGSALADRNIISNSNAFGIQLAGAGAEGSTVQNNLIGTGTDVGTDLGNGDGGVVINGASQVTLGGEGVLRNLIAFNNQGVIVLGAGGSNRLHANEFVANNALGIDLSAGAGPNGVTPNDVNDVDTGPNGLQNFPLLTDGSATPTSITINGTLDVPAGIVTPVAYTLAFYESAACDASGNGEGEIHLGSFPVPLASNAENFSVTLPMPPAPGPTVITATATDPQGNTSEFSNCLATPQPVAIFSNGFE